MQSWRRNRELDELMRTNGYLKMFFATILTYFQIIPDTKGTTVLSGKEEFQLLLLGGKLPDKHLDAYPTRDGTRVSFAEDIELLLKQKQ